MSLSRLLSETLSGFSQLRGVTMTTTTAANKLSNKCLQPNKLLVIEDKLLQLFAVLFEQLNIDL